MLFLRTITDIEKIANASCEPQYDGVTCWPLRLPNHIANLTCPDHKGLTLPGKYRLSKVMLYCLIAIIYNILNILTYK